MGRGLAPRARELMSTAARRRDSWDSCGILRNRSAGLPSTPALAHHGEGRSSAHPIACATFCFWRGKGGACERRSWRGGARSPAAAAHAASRPTSIITGALSWTPITREQGDFTFCANHRLGFAICGQLAAPQPDDILPKNELKGYRASLGSHPTQGRKIPCSPRVDPIQN